MRVSDSLVTKIRKSSLLPNIHDDAMNSLIALRKAR
jgi:hypothetical protein